MRGLALGLGLHGDSLADRGHASERNGAARHTRGVTADMAVTANAAGTSVTAATLQEQPAALSSS